MTDPRNVAHDKKVQQEKKHRHEEVAPGADAKLFVTAAPEVRARRRFEELTRMGLTVHYEDVLLDIRARDERDMGRAAAPLVRAEDAILLDTSAMGRDEAVAAAIAAVEQRLAAARA